MPVEEPSTASLADPCSAAKSPIPRVVCPTSACSPRRKVANCPACDQARLLIMTSKADDGASPNMSRRNLFKHAGAASAAVAISVASAVPGAVAQPSSRPATPERLEALETLTAAEADTLEAIVARLIPSDANGPGAAEARAAHYIDRALTGPLRASRESSKRWSRTSGIS
jgi:Gluconate 2-dehydrogenase subunit 3